jgi:hypothetical protein
MEINLRSLAAIIHGMGFGALYLMACSGALVEIYRRYSARPGPAVTLTDEKFLRNYLIVMAVLAWLTVLSGTYLIYPWYRAVPPPDSISLIYFPQRLLLSSPTTSGWHSIGMEWKEHVAWIVPISITMAAAVCSRYGRSLRVQPELRATVLAFVWVSLIAAGVAGFFGAMIARHAPLEGGKVIHMVEEGSR